MNKIDVLVVEDESIVSIDIQYSLKKIGYNIIGSATTGEKAIQIAQEMRPDIILMDIMLNSEMSGIEAAAIIKKEFNIPIIFLTAYTDEDTLDKAKVTEPYGYIIKPFKDIDIRSTIEMALYKHRKEKEVLRERDIFYKLAENVEHTDNFIFVKSKSKLVKIKTKEIYYIEALKDYVVINILSGRYTIHSTMKEIQSKMPSNEFLRVHRSYIVRIDKINQIDFPNIMLEDNKKTVPIGGSYKDELYTRINLI